MIFFLVSLIFLKRSLFFSILLFSSISLHCSFKKAFLYLLAILWNSAFRWVHLYFSPVTFPSFLFSAIYKASLDNRFAFLHFCWGLFCSPPSVQCYKPLVHSSSDTLPELAPWIYLSFPLCHGKGLDLGHTWIAPGFPYFLQFKSEYCNKEIMIWATASGLVFADSRELLYLWLQRT